MKPTPSKRNLEKNARCARGLPRPAPGGRRRRSHSRATQRDPSYRVHSTPDPGSCGVSNARAARGRAARPQPENTARRHRGRPPFDRVPPRLNPNTRPAVVAAARVSSWMRAHGHEDVAREIRNGAARMTGNEPAGLYALQTTLRRIRVVNITDSASQERLKALVSELRT